MQDDTTLPPGTSLGPYEIQGLLGRGGMGEVYRARDTRLDRDVAIKVLPERLSDDTDFRRRLEREAKTISQLQHPQVCTLYDIGAQDDRDYLVMELLQGETLQERLKRGPLAPEEVIATGSQIAEAIEAAHRLGIAHRDLKPGNVMLTPTGVKVLDFGLAKGTSAAAAVADTQMATATDALTAHGSIVGTLHYMAPEQLEGKDADSRSDLFALGVVLYEMATGHKPFEGDSQALVLASILKSAPESLRTRDPETPRRLEWLIERCLEKDPERRLQSARDVAIELEAVSSEDDVPDHSEPKKPRWLSPRVLAALAAGLVGGSLLAAFFLSRDSETATANTTQDDWTTSTLDLEAPPTLLALSQDGRRLIHGSPTSLFVREMKSPTSVALPNTNGVREAVFFSPEGDRFVFADSVLQLHNRSISGQDTQELGRGVAGFVSAEGLLYYTRPSVPFDPGLSELWRQPIAGGEPEALGLGFLLSGGLLPGDTSGYVFQFEGRRASLTLRSFETGEQTELGPGGNAHYLAPGFLVYFLDGAIWAVRVDSETHLPVGEARVVETGVLENGAIDGIFALSRGGDLVYRTGGVFGHVVATWVDTAGETLGDVAPESGRFRTPRISPDGKKLSLTVATGPRLLDAEEWRLDLASGVFSRRAQASSYTGVTQWIGPAGDEVIFASNRDDPFVYHLFVESAQGGAPATRLTPDEDGSQMLLAVSPNGRHVLYFHPIERRDFMVLDRETGRTRQLQPEGEVTSASFHPQGGFIAYADQGPDPGLWVMPFGDASEPIRPAARLTRGPHTEVTWSPDGTELYYRSPTHIMSISVTLRGDQLDTGLPRELFEDRFQTHIDPGFTNYAVHPDGRFLFMRDVDDRDDRVVYIQNWRAKVEALFAEDLDERDP